MISKFLGMEIPFYILPVLMQMEAFETLLVVKMHYFRF
jgi:hypothetical protein